MNIKLLSRLYRMYGLKPVRGAFHIKDYADPLAVDYLYQHPYVDKLRVEDEEIERWAETSYGKEYVYGFVMGWDSGEMSAEIDKEPEKYRIGYRDAIEALKTIKNDVALAKTVL